MKIEINGVERELDTDELNNQEAIVLEDHFGLTFGEITELAGRGSVKVITGVVWVILRRENPDISFDDVAFKFVAEEEPAAAAPFDLAAVSPSASSTSSTSPTSTGSGVVTIGTD